MSVFRPYVREGLNLMGSICSIFAVLMAISIRVDVVTLVACLAGVMFGVIIMGTLIVVTQYFLDSCARLQFIEASVWGQMLSWMLVILIVLWIGLILGALFGYATYAFGYMMKDLLVNVLAL